MTSKKHDQGRPLGLVKVLSWSFFALVLGSSLFLSAFLSNYAQDVMLAKQQEFSLLLAENLNHQIYRRYMLPTLVGYGRINLSDKEQSARLDQVVRSTLHSFNADELRIYDFNFMISYSLDPGMLGKTDLAPPQAKEVLATGDYSFELINKVPTLVALFKYRLEPGSVLLKTFYPLRAETTPGVGPTGNPIIGILELTQDITGEFRTVLNLDRLIIVSSVVTFLILFLVMFMIIRRTDRLNTQRLKERDKLERELIERERFASMGRVVASIAHEIRNPLGIIQSSAELLLSWTKAGKMPSESIIKAIFDESRRLSRTVNDFLDYARPKRPSRDLVNLAPVVDQALLFMKPQLDETGVEVKTDYRNQGAVCGDKDLLYRAVYNVIANALQAMDGPGVLGIQCVSFDGEVRLAVDDSGPGFEPEVLDKVLDPFFTTKDTGTGLGLAIVSSIVESHGGRLEFSNNDGGGARVETIFPVAKDEC